jgi:hypothetical protein
MTEVSMSLVARRDVETCAGGNHAAPGVAWWLGLAAAPTFAIMALWTGLLSGQPDMFCMAMQSSSSMSGMTMMYLLMSAFHAAPADEAVPIGRLVIPLGERCSSRQSEVIE